MQGSNEEGCFKNKAFIYQNKISRKAGQTQNVQKNNNRVFVCTFCFDFKTKIPRRFEIYSNFITYKRGTIFHVIKLTILAKGDEHF